MNVASSEDSGKLRLGLWGCGRRTKELIRKACEDGQVSISCCYDINEEAARTVAESHGARIVASEDELLADGQTDAFLICLYPGLHAMALKKAIPVGKPIYVEKPVATNWEDYQELLHLNSTNKTFVHVGLMHRYVPLFSTLTELVKTGKVGRLVGVATNWICRLKPVEEFPGGRDDWHFREDTGGELIQHFCHTFDWLRCLGGDFSHIMAMNNHLVDTSIPIEDNWEMLLRYENGALVNFHSSMRNDRNTEMGWIEGSEGSLEWEWNDPSRIRFCPASKKWHDSVDIPVVGDGGNKEKICFAAFLDAVNSGTPPDISLADGLWSVLVPLMASRSAKELHALSFAEYSPTVVSSPQVKARSSKLIEGI